MFTICSMLFLMYLYIVCILCFAFSTYCSSHQQLYPAGAWRRNDVVVPTSMQRFDTILPLVQRQQCLIDVSSATCARWINACLWTLKTFQYWMLMFSCRSGLTENVLSCFEYLLWWIWFCVFNCNASVKSVELENGPNVFAFSNYTGTNLLFFRTT